MKVLILASCAAFAVAASAQAKPAYPFAPAQTNFTASGAAVVTTSRGTVHCTETIGGYTGKNGMAHITSATFSAGDAACSNISAAGLPWKTMPTGPNSGKIVDMALVSGGVSCGPALVRMTVNGSGVWSYSDAKMTSACHASATLPTSPAIVPSAP